MNTPKPLRILHIIDQFYPQLGYQETFLSKVEKEQGYDVYVLTGNLFDKILYEANKGILKQRKTKVGEFVERGVRTIRLPAVNLPGANVLYLLGLEKTITELRPDVIVCHGIVFLTSIRLARLRKRLPKTKLIFDDHMTFNATRGGIFRYVYALFRLIFTPMILKSADTVVAVTYETRKFMKEIYGIPEERIKIIPLGVDTLLFRRDPSAREKIRGRYGIADDDVVFIYAGKILPEKGPHLLVEAALEIIKENPNVKIMLVGGGKHGYKAFLERKTKTSKFEHNFIFVPGVANEELYKYYSTADVGVWPLQCSLAMLEAMSSGLPIIISDNSGALERISERTGLAYREGDAMDLAKKMKTLLNPKSRKSMGLRAREFAEKNDWQVISRILLESVDFEIAK